MDRFLSVLSQTEKDPTRTNDLKGTDFFRILENFIDGVLTFSKNVVSKIQLQKFILVLEEYIHSKPLFQRMYPEEVEHLKKRKSFVKQVHEKKWAVRSREIVETMDVDH